MAGLTAPSHNVVISHDTLEGDSNPLERLLAWIRSFWNDEDEGAPSSSDTPPAGEEGAPDCARLAALVAAYGPGQGRALFAREIQHEGGRQGFRSGGWMGAIIGGIAGTGRGVDSIRDCEGVLGESLTDLGDASREARREIRDERSECKDECDRRFTNHSIIGPRGKPWRECRRGCRHEARDARRDLRGGEPSAGSAWLRTLMP